MSTPLAELRDLRQAVRRLLRRPLFTLAAVGLLGAGLGVTAFTLSLYEQVAWRPLPVERPAELFLAQLAGVTERGEAPGRHPFTYADFRALERAAGGEIELVAVGNETGLWTEGDRTERIVTAWVSPGFFDLLGVRPAAGRLFDPALDAAADEPQVVLSHAAWLRRFGADPGVVGRPLRVDGRSVEVIGVAPRGFRGVELGDAPELYRLAGARAAESGLFAVFGRLPPGATLASVGSRLATHFDGILAEQPDRRHFVLLDGKMTAARLRVDVEPGARGVTGSTEVLARMLRLVGAMIALVLAIVVANLANLMAARATAERRDAAIRRALGAGRWAVARVWLLESALLAAAGATLGLLVARLAGPRLLAWLPTPDLELAFEIAPDPSVVALTALVAFAVALGCGALAARESRRDELVDRLRGDGPTTAGDHAGSRGRWALVAGQVALSAVLLVATALLARSLDRLLAIDPGFRLDRVSTFRFDLVDRDPERAREILERAEREIAALPGVASVATSPMTVLSGMRSFSLLSVEGYEPAPGETTMIESVRVTPRFFATIGLAPLAGALPEEATGGRAAVVNRSFVERYFAGRDPIGGRIAYGTGPRRWGDPASDDELVVAAVVADTVIGDVRESATPRLYAPFDRGWAPASFYVRADRDIADLAPELRRAVAAAAPDAMLFDLRTLDQRRDRRLAQETFLRDLSLGLGGFALMLAASGLYGVLAFVTARRGREIALRIALGARPASVIRFVARDAALAVAAGLAIGFAAALPAVRLVRGFLYGVGTWEPLAFVIAAVALALAATAAVWLPAARAARLDPATMLRAD